MLTAAGALIALNVLEIALIRRDWFNRKYTPLLTELTALVEPGDVVATSYPPLIANEIDCATVGGAWLVPNLPGLIERYAPDMIVVDDYRKADNNYILLEQRDFEIPGYTLVRHAPEQHYAIYRKEERDRQNSGRKDRRRPEVE